MILMEAQLVSIYSLTDPRDGRVRYVGRSENPQRRLLGHLSCGDGSPGKRQWIRSLRADGQKPTIAVLETVPFKQAKDAERQWIERLVASGASLLNGEVSRRSLTLSFVADTATIAAIHRIASTIESRDLCSRRTAAIRVAILDYASRIP